MTNTDLWLAILYALFLWWFSTGAILWVVRLPRTTYRWSMLAGTLLAGVGLYGLIATRGDASIIGAYVAFTSALLIWGWNEMTFLLGYVLGPRKAPCPPDAQGWRRFGLATMTLIYHEIALLVCTVALFAISWGQPNQIGAWTFLILFVMRLSAKFNLFLGVPNLNEEFVPAHLQHLTSYMPKRGMNALFPVSVLLSGLLAIMLLQTAMADQASVLEFAGLTLLFTLTALALIEHLFMVVPLPDAALWRWALPSQSAELESAPFIRPTTARSWREEGR